MKIVQTKSPLKIERWSVNRAPVSPYTDPCAMPEVVVQGECHEAVPLGLGGPFIRTSPIRHAIGRRIVTASGSEYELGEPHPNYVAWCERNGIALDTENPILMVTVPTAYHLTAEA